MTLRTVAQLMNSPPPEPALGKRLWAPTSQVVYPSPFLGYSGKLGHEEIHSVRGTTCVVRPYKAPSDPATDSQVAKRIYMGHARGNWHTVSAQNRQAWKTFALEQLYAGEKMTGRTAALAGNNAWVAAQFYRQGMELPLSLAAPAFAVPEAVLDLQEVAPPEVGAFAFRLYHAMPEIADCSVVFEISPQMPTLKRQPRDQDMRWAGVSDPESFLPLGPDGAIYLLPRARFAVAAGRLYGVRARILSPDGVPGKELMRATIRRAPAPEVW